MKKNPCYDRGDLIYVVHVVRCPLKFSSWIIDRMVRPIRWSIFSSICKIWNDLFSGYSSRICV